jgi:hypothetical protein
MKMDGHGVIALLLAASVGHLDCLIYTHGNGCPWFEINNGKRCSYIAGVCIFRNNIKKEEK